MSEVFTLTNIDVSYAHAFWYMKNVLGLFRPCGVECCLILCIIGNCLTIDTASYRRVIVFFLKPVINSHLSLVYLSVRLSGTSVGVFSSELHIAGKEIFRDFSVHFKFFLVCICTFKDSRPDSLMAAWDCRSYSWLSWSRNIQMK